MAVLGIIFCNTQVCKNIVGIFAIHKAKCFKYLMENTFENTALDKQKIVETFTFLKIFE